MLRVRRRQRKTCPQGGDGLGAPRRTRVRPQGQIGMGANGLPQSSRSTERCPWREPTTRPSLNRMKRHRKSLSGSVLGHRSDRRLMDMTGVEFLGHLINATNQRAPAVTGTGKANLEGTPAWWHRAGAGGREAGPTDVALGTRPIGARWLPATALCVGRWQQRIRGRGMAASPVHRPEGAWFRL